MFEQPAREALADDVFWKVQFVFTDKSLTNDFAYTVGLAERGFPELYIEATPKQAVSDSPWTLSSQDCAHELNKFARMLLAGELVAGKPIVRTYDHGCTTLDWTPGEPTARDNLEVYCTDPTCMVVPVHAEMRPIDIVPLRDLALEDEARFRAELMQAAIDTVPNPRGLRGFRAPRYIQTSFSCTQTYGPLTPVVEARIYAISQATPEMLTDLLLRGLDAEQAFGPRAVLGVAHAHAKRVSRLPAAWNADAQAVTLVKLLRGRDGNSLVWRTIRKLTGFTKAEDAGGIRRGLSGCLVDAVSALLVATTVEDQLDESTRLAALGPWSSARESSTIAPDKEWWAPPHILDAIRSSVIDLQLDQIRDLHSAWGDLREGSLVPLLRGLAITGARGCLPAKELLFGHPIGFAAMRDPDVDAFLTEFLCCASALLSERAMFSADAVLTFCEPLRAVLPNLEAVMNAPLSEIAA